MSSSVLQQLGSCCRISCTTLCTLFDSLVQRANGCIYGPPPFDYPTWAPDQLITCCSRASWTFRRLYLVASLLDLLGLLPFDSALERFTLVLTLIIGVSIMESDRDWSSTYSNFYAVALGLVIIGSCFKSWRERGKKRHEIRQKLAADAMLAAVVVHPQQQPQQQQMEQQRHPRRIANEAQVEEVQEEKEALLAAAVPVSSVPSRAVVPRLRSLILSSSPTGWDSWHPALTMVGTELSEAEQSDRLSLSYVRQLTDRSTLAHIRSARPTQIVAFMAHVRPDDCRCAVINDMDRQTASFVSMDLIAHELVEFNRSHASEPIQCVMLPNGRAILDTLISAVDFCITFDVPPCHPRAYCLFLIGFHLALLDGLRIDEAVQRARRDVELSEGNGLSNQFRLYACAPDILRPLYGPNSQKAPARLAARTSNEVALPVL